MYNKIKQFFYWWSKQNFICFVLISVVLQYLGRIPIDIIFDLIPVDWYIEMVDISTNKISSHNDFLLSFFVLCVFVPFFETIFSQYIPIAITSKITPNRYVQVIVSSLVFGISHFYNLGYIIATIISGFFFALGYLLYKEKYNTKKAFWATSLTHSIINLVAILAFYID